MKPIYKFRWNHKGTTAEGDIIRPSGTGYAPDSNSALDHIDAMLRRRFPEVRWMHRNEIEDDNIKYGPSVQMNKTPMKPKAKK